MEFLSALSLAGSLLHRNSQKYFDTYVVLIIQINSIRP